MTHIPHKGWLGFGTKWSLGNVCVIMHHASQRTWLYKFLKDQPEYWGFNRNLRLKTERNVCINSTLCSTWKILTLFYSVEQITKCHIVFNCQRKKLQKYKWERDARRNSVELDWSQIHQHELMFILICKITERYKK